MWCRQSVVYFGLLSWFVAALYFVLEFEIAAIDCLITCFSSSKRYASDRYDLVRSILKQCVISKLIELSTLNGEVPICIQIVVWSWFYHFLFLGKRARVKLL